MLFRRVVPAALALLACLAAPCAGAQRDERGDDGPTLQADIDLRRAPHAVGPAAATVEAASISAPPTDTLTIPPPAPPTARPTAEREDNRRLAAPREAVAMRPQRAGLATEAWARLPVNSVGAGAAALAIVVGLFLLLITCLKKARPRSQRALPGEVVTVLGRTPLSGKQVVHLLKVGGKLVLVSVTPDGVAPIAEVTDPDEVVRLLGLCEQQSEHSASAAFRDVFDRLARDQNDASFPGADAGLVDRQRLAAAYAKTPGGRAHG